MTPARARTRRRLAGLALSLGVHAALLLVFMSVTPRLLAFPRAPAPPEPAFQVELARAPAAARAASAGPRRASAAAAIPLPALPARPVLRPSELPPPGPPSAAAASAAGAAPPAAPEAADGRWRVRGEGGDAGAAARALARGTVGCGDAAWLHLAREERDRCNTELVRGLRTLRVDAIPAGKRAYYDEVVARTEAARGVAPYDTLHQHEMEMRRDRGVDMAAEARCAIRFGAGAARANRDDPCHLHLPLSPLTAETRVPPPPSLADQTADARAAARLDAPLPQPPKPGAGG